MSNTVARPIVCVKGYERDEEQGGIPPYAEDILRAHFHVVTYEDVTRNTELARRVEGIILWPRSARLVHAMVPQMPNLKIVSGYGTGHDYFSSTYAKFGIPLANTPGANATEVADFAWALLMACAVNLIPAVRLAMNKGGLHTFDSSHKNHDVSGATVGIVGLGRVGKILAKRASAFDMSVLYVTSSGRPYPAEESEGAAWCASLIAMLPLCDYVVISCPLTTSTRHMFGEREFGAMKRSASLVNIARGEIIDQQALCDALRRSEIRSAAIDVTYPEPLPRDHPLLDLPNLFITSHIASVNDRALRRMHSMHVNNLKAAILNNAPIPYRIVL